MKKFLLPLAIVLLIASTLLVFQEFRIQISQECGEPSVKETQIWLWDWLLHRDQVFIACIGSTEIGVYRPLDISAVCFILSLGIGYLAFRRK